MLWVPEICRVISGNSGRLVDGIMSVAGRKIKMPGAIGWAVEQQQTTAFEHAIDDGLSEVMVRAGRHPTRSAEACW